MDLNAFPLPCAGPLVRLHVFMRSRASGSLSGPFSK